MRRIVFPVFAALAFSTVFLFQASTPKATVAAAPRVAPPQTLAGFQVNALVFCQNEKCGRMQALETLKGATNCPICAARLDAVALGEKKILPRDTVIRKRLYTASNGQTFVVSYVIGGTSKSSIHRPELCLPSQGYLMRKPKEESLDGRPWHVLAVTAPHGTSEGTLAYTFFNQSGYRTSSHVARIFRDTWDRSVLNRVDRWVMVTVNAACGPGPALDGFLRTLGRTLDESVPAPRATEEP